MSNVVSDMKGEPPQLSKSERNVIEQLIGREKYGLELVADSDRLLSRSSVYVLLGRMEDKGLIAGREVAAQAGENGPPRRIYKATGHGVRALHAYEAALAVWRGAR